MTKIIWLHVPEIKNYMKPTESFILDLIEDDFEVISGITPKDVTNAISKPLIEHWLTDDIIIIGQDNLPTIKMIYELAKCNYDLCVNPCLMYEASTALKKIYQNQQMQTTDGNYRLLDVDERPSFVDYGGTGVSKISKAIQYSIDLKNNPCGFPTLDSTIHRLKPRYCQWHTHYPMHKHNKNSMENRHWT